MILQIEFLFHPMPLPGPPPQADVPTPEKEKQLLTPLRAPTAKKSLTSISSRQSSQQINLGDHVTLPQTAMPPPGTIHIYEILREEGRG